MTYQPLHHKYRPQTFADLVGQDAIATTLSNALQQQRIAPAYLFTGARGTGKTSSARILAKSLNCLKSQTPTAQPCGVCDLCRAIADGSALDVIEIDAASNTGVDNIRELIERAQFAPVQCRYKVYTIDECLTGDAMVLTQSGSVRIGNPRIQGKQVLSYNESSNKWEFKRVVRWLDQGKRQTLEIHTTWRQITCTDNHLIRTNRGWIAAKNLGTGDKILSPVPVIAAPPLLNLAQMVSGSPKFPQKGWTGGTGTMSPLPLVPKAAPKSNSIRKGILPQKTTLSLSGLAAWDTPPKTDATPDPRVASNTTTSRWEQREQMPCDSGCQIYAHTLSPQWHTSLETVLSVRLAGVEPVYDIEVEDNHNFVANGLLVHNCHMLSQSAFNALLKTLEEPPDRVVFILATTDPQRVLPTIISRCQRFDFRRIPLDAIGQHLRLIADKEAIVITDAAITLVGQLAQGGLRDAESLLDQLSLLAGEISVEQVWDLVGAVPERDLMALLEAIAANAPEPLLDHVRRLMDRGREPLTVLQNLASFYRDLLIAKTAPARPDLVALTSATWTTLCKFAQKMDLTTILVGQQHLRSCEMQLKTTTQPRLWLEVTLMGLLPAATGQPPATGQSVAPPRSLPAQPSEPDRSREPLVPKPAPPSRSESLQPDKLPPTPDPPEVTAEATPPEPVPSEPLPSEADESPNLAPVAIDLNQIWQAMLQQLQPPSTRMLLSQQGGLLGLTDHDVRVGVIPQWFKTAKLKVANLEAAFEQVLKHPVVIHLEMAAPADLKAAKASPAPNNPDPSSGQELPAPPDRPPEPLTPPEASTNPFSEPPDSEPSFFARESIDPATGWQQEDELTQASKQLADFFGGRIVDLNDTETPIADSSVPTQEPERSPEPTTTWEGNGSDGDPESDADSDDDIAF